MRKVPTIVLSITYKGVKFIDAANKVPDPPMGGNDKVALLFFVHLWWTYLSVLLQNIIAEHEIRNISCAAQDPEDLCTFAYITKDLQTSHHYCHVFSTVDVVRTHFSELNLFVRVTHRAPFFCLQNSSWNSDLTQINVATTAVLP